MEPMKTNGVDVGEDALNVYIVAPARFNHDKEGCMLAYPAYVDMNDANDKARAQAADSNRDVCVYRLVTSTRYSAKWTK